MKRKFKVNNGGYINSLKICYKGSIKKQDDGTGGKVQEHF